MHGKGVPRVPLGCTREWPGSAHSLLVCITTSTFCHRLTRFAGSREEWGELRGRPVHGKGVPRVPFGCTHERPGSAHSFPVPITTSTRFRHIPQIYPICWITRIMGRAAGETSAWQRGATSPVGVLMRAARIGPFFPGSHHNINNVPPHSTNLSDLLDHENNGASCGGNKRMTKGCHESRWGAHMKRPGSAHSFPAPITTSSFCPDLPDLLDH